MPAARIPAPRARRAGRVLLGLALIALAGAAGGCATGHPRPVAAVELAEAQSFPYYRVYWVGPRFQGNALAAVDGLRSYINTVGDSVYYGDCVRSKGIFGGGSCLLPLQVTTVVRGVPATAYDQGRSIELYTGRVAIDIFSDSFPRALDAAQQLLPLNAPGSTAGPLPPPVYCPGLSGPIDASVNRVLQHLPGHACQKAAAAVAFAEQLTD